MIVRFTEFERYDINRDCDVVRFMATTPKGSFYAEVPILGPKSYRTLKERFKEQAIEYIQSGYDPGEVEIES